MYLPFEVLRWTVTLWEVCHCRLCTGDSSCTEIILFLLNANLRNSSHILKIAVFIIIPSLLCQMWHEHSLNIKLWLRSYFCGYNKSFCICHCRPYLFSVGQAFEPVGNCLSDGTEVVNLPPLKTVILWVKAQQLGRHIIYDSVAKWESVLYQAYHF